jgi:hypothetical protein
MSSASTPLQQHTAAEHPSAEYPLVIHAEQLVIYGASLLIYGASPVIYVVQCLTTRVFTHSKWSGCLIRVQSAAALQQRCNCMQHYVLYCNTHRSHVCSLCSVYTCVCTWVSVSTPVHNTHSCTRCGIIRWVMSHNVLSDGGAVWARLLSALRRLLAYLPVDT